MVGAVSFFDGFVLLKAFRSQIHLLPEWQLWGFFLICTNPRWPSSMLRIHYLVPFVLQCIHVTCGGTISKAHSFHQLKVAFNNAFRMLHNLPTYCSASEMFTVNRVADCKAVIRNLVHRFISRLMISKHLLVRSILSSDLVWSSRIRRHWARLLYVHIGVRANIIRGGRQSFARMASVGGGGG